MSKGALLIVSIAEAVSSGDREVPPKRGGYRVSGGSEFWGSAELWGALLRGHRVQGKVSAADAGDG